MLEKLAVSAPVADSGQLRQLQADAARLTSENAGEPYIVVLSYNVFMQFQHTMNELPSMPTATSIREHRSQESSW